MTTPHASQETPATCGENTEDVETGRGDESWLFIDEVRRWTAEEWEQLRRRLEEAARR